MGDKQPLGTVSLPHPGQRVRGSARAGGPAPAEGGEPAWEQRALLKK